MQVELNLPKPVFTKYVTASFLDAHIQANNYADPNIDMQHVLFKGTPLKIS